MWNDVLYFLTLEQLRECIDPLRFWLRFWCSRAFILWTYHLIGYTLSFVPGIVAKQVMAYITTHHAVFAVISDWSILWLLVMDSSLNWIASHLSSTIFRVHILTEDDDINRRGSVSGLTSPSLSPSRGSRRREIRSGGLADHISLSSVNALLSRMLSVIRLFVPNVVYETIHDGLYQFLIFFSFLLFSPKLGCLMLGYLLPIYTSILALYHLHELRSKIELWNSGQRDELITPEPSLLITDPNSSQMLRSRRNRHRQTTTNVLSPSRSNPVVSRRRNEGISSNLDDGGASVSASKSWSSLRFWLKPLNMFSFHGTDDLTKNERKRKKMHQEADHVLSTIVDRLKYWIVFAAMEWMYYVIGEQLGLMYYVPFWNHIKFALILWIQLPYVPYSAQTLYEYLIVPVVVLDIQGSGHQGNEVIGAQIVSTEETEQKMDDETVSQKVEQQKVENVGISKGFQWEMERKVKHQNEVSLSNDGAKSMMMIPSKRKRRPSMDIQAVSRGGSVPMSWKKARALGREEDEDSGSDKKSDRGDDDEQYRRKMNEQVQV